jgi:type VI protein secretion system component VasF
VVVWYNIMETKEDKHKDWNDTLLINNREPSATTITQLVSVDENMHQNKHKVQTYLLVIMIILMVILLTMVSMMYVNQNNNKSKENS